MNDSEIKTIWSQTISSDGWDAADVHHSYQPRERDTADYAPAQRRPNRLPRARFTHNSADELPSVAPASTPATATVVVVDESISQPPDFDHTFDSSAVSSLNVGQASVEEDNPGAEGVATIAYEAFVSGVTIQEDPGTATFIVGNMEAPDVSVIHHSDPSEHENLNTLDDDSTPSARISGVDLRDAGASYEIIDELGRGGMGVIFRAVQGSLERKVAIKTLIPDRANEKAREKFVGEALVTGGLDHPNVVPVHELGCNQEGEVFLAMKLVDGRSWKELLHPRSEAARQAAQGWDLQRHIEVLLDVTNAISFAHSRGIIHRDLKPENVMVGAYGETLVMDWGIAVDIRDPPPERTRAPHRSQVSGPAGTPVYMSPEQAEGRGKDLGEWTDVYLLGAILHELVTGDPPHHRQGSRLLDVLVTASHSAEPTYDPSVPRALQDICKTAMARESEDRFASVAAFQTALQTWIGHRESLRLADEADALATSIATGDVSPHDRYGVFTRALARYEQALVTWPENNQALAGQAATAHAYANEALRRKDFGVVEAQLDLLTQNPQVEAGAIEALRAALKSRRAANLRTIVALGVIVASSFLSWQGIQAIAARGEQEGARVAAQHAFDRKAQDAWNSVKTSDLLEVSRQETRLSEDPKARQQEGRDRVKAVRGAKKLLLWSQKRWQELFNIQCRDFRKGLIDAGGADPKLDERLAATLTGELLRRAADDPTSRSLCKVFEAELLGGTTPAIVLSAFDEMQKTAPKKAQRRLRRRRRLLDASACELSPQAIELSLTSTATDACLVKTLPFVLTLPPVGPRLRRRTPIPVMRRGRNHEWIALDRRTRKELWRTELPGEDTASEVVLAVSDGSVMIGDGAFMRRYHGRSGRILGRIVLPSAPLLAWPDPIDRRKMRVIAWSNRDQGRVAVLTFAGGRAYQPVIKSDAIEHWWRTSPTVIGMERRLRERLATKLDVDADSDGPKMRRALFAALMKAADRDPYEPDLPARALHAGGAAIDKHQREKAADRAVAAARGLLPVHAVRIASGLIRNGFPTRAKALIEQASNGFIDNQGNADLAGFRIGNPADLLRKLGGELFSQGKTAAALKLVERGHSFSTVLEGDTTFYQRYQRWLTDNGRPHGDSVAEFARLAAQAGGVMILAPIEYLLTDMAAVTVAVAPLLLLLLLLRLWWVARPSRIAALHFQGLDGFRARLGAFLSDPWLRIRHTFWAYASRGQRLMVVVIAILCVGSASTLASNMSILGRSATAPLHLAFGYPAQPAFLKDVRHELDVRGKDPALLRLLAEGLRARKRNKGARQTIDQLLEISPDDATSRNNLGVLLEEATDIEAARTAYELASADTGDGAHVAAWNLARLDNAKLPTASLAHRDRLRARRFGSKKPLWALCSLTDQRQLLVPHHSLTERVLRAFSHLVRGEIAHLNSAGDVVGSLMGSDTARSMIGISAVACIVFAALGLLWLPFTTLPLIAAVSPDPLARNARRRRMQRGLVAVGSLVLPGLRLLVSTRIAAGALILTLFAVLAALWSTVQYGGLVSGLIDPGAALGFFGELEAPSVHVGFAAWGQAAGIAIVALFAVNLVAEIRVLVAGVRNNNALDRSEAPS